VNGAETIGAPGFSPVSPAWGIRSSLQRQGSIPYNGAETFNLSPYRKRPMGLTVQPDIGRSALRKAAWRLIPFLCLLYVFNILDRVNAGFARLTMQYDLCLEDTAFDIGFGLFYIGYLTFEVPSNFLLRHFGARAWLARIVIVWGAVSCLNMFVYDTTSFIVVRILLGIAEAGFFPGIVLYLTYWFPARERAGIMAWFMTGVAVAGIFGNPISGAIVSGLHEEYGMQGWQWLFLLEGLPSVLLGVLALWALTDKPAEATWLTPEERDWLTRTMAEEEAQQTTHQADHWAAMVDGRVWLLIALYATVATGSNAAGAHFPRMIQGQFPRAAPWEVGLLGSLPHIAALVAMVLWGRNSDQTGERRWHVGLAALAAAVGWTVAALSPHPYVVLAGLCLAQAGMISMLPTFWTLPPLFLTGAAAAGGIALINSVANIGGFFGAYVLGAYGPWSMVAIMAAGLPLALLVRHERGGETGGELNLRPVGAGGAGIRGG
jgi:ACS family tartrate transporter-like MFS transporter